MVNPRYGQFGYNDVEPDLKSLVSTLKQPHSKSLYQQHLQILENFLMMIKNSFRNLLLNDKYI